MIYQALSEGFIVFLSRNAPHHVTCNSEVEDLTKYAQRVQHYYIVVGALLSQAPAKECGKLIQKRLYYFRDNEFKRFAGLRQFPGDKLMLPNTLFTGYRHMQERLHKGPDHQLR